MQAGDEIPASDAVSDVDAVYEWLKREAPGTLGGRARAHELADRYWPVTAEQPLRRGGVAAYAQRLLRKLMRWYVEPLAQDQRVFNRAALELIDDLQRRVDELERLLDERP
jgi:hypothetical protein